MITLHDIETTIADRLKSVGHTVTAAEIDEGFDKPTFFIDIFQNSVARENQFMELVNIGIELRYFSETGTREVLVKMADELRELLMAEPLTVVDRFLSINEIFFDKDNGVLLTYFELEFMRETAAVLPQYDKMKNIEIGVKPHGTSAGTN